MSATAIVKIPPGQVVHGIRIGDGPNVTLTDELLNRAQLAGVVSDNAVTWEDVFRGDVLRFYRWAVASERAAREGRLL